MVAGLAAFIKSIPGLAKAVADLVGDIANLGSSAAKLGSATIDRPRRAIEDKTKRATALSEAATDSVIAITKAISEAAVHYIKANSVEIGERALAHGVHRLIKQQHNREMVVVEAIENLRIDPPHTAPSEPPSDDWLNLFGRYAENASSEKMRKHWAHLLEGEIRRPGSFSFITLHLASVLDERLANTIEQFRPWIFEQNIPLINPISEGERYSELITLAAIGFLDMGNHSLNFELDDGANDIRLEFDTGTLVIPFGQRATVKMGNVSVPEFRVEIPTATITPAGIELLSVLPKIPQNEDMPKLILEYLQKDGFFGITFTSKA
jgi:hypothetical protein